MAGDTNSNSVGGGNSNSSEESDTESDSGLSECGYGTEMVERADESSEEDEDPFGDGSAGDCDDDADGEFEKLSAHDADGGEDRGDDDDYYQGPKAPSRVIDMQPYDLC